MSRPSVRFVQFANITSENQCWKHFPVPHSIVKFWFQTFDLLEHIYNLFVIFQSNFFEHK